MSSRPLVKALWPSLLLPCTLWLACEREQPNNPYVDPPQVSMEIPEPNTVGMSMQLELSVSGCEQVQALELYNRDELLKPVAYTGNPTAVQLAASDIDYTQGIAARLTLKARVTCADGRIGTTQPQAATFFPVAYVKEPEQLDEQVVTDFFVAEGQGDTVVFIGCNVDSTNRSWLYRINQRGEVLRQAAMPFPCTARTTITDRHPVTRKRWLWTPDVGAVAFDELLQYSGNTDVQLDMLMVGPDGDAVVWDTGYAATPTSLRRIDHRTATTAPKWVMEGTASRSSNRFIPGVAIAEMRMRNNTSLLVPLWAQVEGEPAARLLVGDANYDTGTWTNLYEIEQRPGSVLRLPPAPTVAFDPTGALIYVVRQTGSVFYVAACAAASAAVPGGNCEQVNRRWLSLDLPDPIALLLPYAGGSRLAAIGVNRTWVLDALTGAVVNKDNQPLQASGTLVASQVYAGLGSDLYLLNAPPPSGQSRPYPVELLATEEAEKGVLLRYEAGGGNSLAAALDDEGRLWLRVGRKLVRALPTNEYRAAINGRP